VNSTFLSSEYPQSTPEEALFQILPVPYEATVSYGGGTASGPAAIIEASSQLEANDGCGNFPGQRGFHTYPAVDCSGECQKVFGRISSAVAQIAALPGRKIPVVLGGEHSISYPVLQPLVDRCGAGQIGIVQIDAHADLRDAYEGNRFSHASAMRRLHADLGLPLVQLGVRALSQEEIDYRAAHLETITAYDARELVPSGVRDIQLPRSFPPLLYLTIDVDGLDPSIMPATGTPVPGGLQWYPLLSLLRSILSQRKLIGMDLVELAPIEGLHHSTFTAVDLLHKVMGMVVASEG